MMSSKRPHSFSRILSLALSLAISVGFLAPQRSGAVIFYETSDPSANTSEPSGALAGSGWQFEGTFGGVLGTPIAPAFFITAHHVGMAGPSIIFRGVTYPLVKGFHDPTTDLTIWQVSGTFPEFAPPYTRRDETGKHLVVIGRGTQRGAEAFLGPDLKGWNWGLYDGVQRWGENTVASIEDGGPTLGELLYSTFDQNGLPNEAHLSSGDSGGAVFIADGGTWKLAGINYGVDDVFQSDGNGGYNRVVAALFDARGYYAYSGTPGIYTLITGTAPAPTGFYATRISSRLAWIYSVIDPNGDASGDGVPNLVKYALGLDPTVSSGSSITQPGMEPGYATITYNKLTTATDITYAVERTSDFMTWTTTSTIDEVVQTNGTIQTIKSKVALNNETQLFLRLRATRN